MVRATSTGRWRRPGRGRRTDPAGRRARRYARAAATGGPRVPRAADELIQLAAELRDLGELRRLADLGNPTATDQLIELAAELEDLTELRRLRTAATVRPPRYSTNSRRSRRCGRCRTGGRALASRPITLSEGTTPSGPLEPRRGCAHRASREWVSSSARRRRTVPTRRATDTTLEGGADPDPSRLDDAARCRSASTWPLPRRAAFSRAWPMPSAQRAGRPPHREQA